MRRFFTSSMAIARNLAQQAQLEETILVYLPFWTVWGRVAAWAFGQEKVGSGDRARYEPREVRVVQEMSWNGAAADVGEFGVNQIPLTNQELDPFNAEALHAKGLVFEPVGSFVEALQVAEHHFHDQVQSKVGLDKLSQLFLRLFRHRTALVYYPLWVMRYLHRGRAYQVVVDGYSGNVLYGKAPGNTMYRAARLVAGMAAGAFIAIDLAATLLYLGVSSGDDDATGILVAALALFAGGMALMYTSYRAFRYGEQYEYRQAGKKGLKLSEIPGLSELSGITEVKEIEKWIGKLP
jgi:hypothetical protein